jgi:D-arabinose 1-dehydrogenase-like Zn-dependent alcohol dehydrogenase
MLHKYESKFKPAAYVIVTLWSNKGLFPGVTYPRIPGHEVAGIIDKVGKDVVEWKPEQRVGIGWHGGQCGNCEFCRRGDLFACRYAQITGFTYDGGYADLHLSLTNFLLQRLRHLCVLV